MVCVSLVFCVYLLFMFVRGVCWVGSCLRDIWSVFVGIDRRATAANQRTIPRLQGGRQQQSKQSPKHAMPSSACLPTPMPAPTRISFNANTDLFSFLLVRPYVLWALARVCVCLQNDPAPAAGGGTANSKGFWPAFAQSVAMIIATEIGDKT